MRECGMWSTSFLSHWMKLPRTECKCSSQQKPDVSCTCGVHSRNTSLPVWDAESQVQPSVHYLSSHQLVKRPTNSTETWGAAAREGAGCTTHFLKSFILLAAAPQCDLWSRSNRWQQRTVVLLLKKRKTLKSCLCQCLPHTLPGQFVCVCEV